MTSSFHPWSLLLVLLLSIVLSLGAPATVFDENFVPVWGADGYHLANQGTQVSLIMDRNSGAGFRSKMMYGSGLFHMRIKLPAGYTAGVVTAFYLTTEPEYGDHDEVDFEFLGNVDGKPVALQTNIFLNGQGYREQKFYLWFDPAAAVHDYKILWNQHQLVMLVDETPIRVLKNLAGRAPGYQFPTRPMRIRASIWDGSSWATDNGKIKVDWNRAPFTSAFQRFNVDACPATGSAPCGSPNLWWNKFQDLTPAQKAAYKNVKSKYMTYNYCDDKARFNYHLPLECSYN
ncbi:xyloglucan endotransglucosylase/hydrolase protein 2-like [Aegilops tauschii subsp. strangulata]|uniref:Xyloglucan endotransglucosylase/hydrolase n=1 Tax=Aegilops tauschii TaxID=37682 RepID=M8CAB3_AEGTA|nr:xyloglucan endotransglucosylase/hydrolase protein 2-like [Aegilops tauschii subsp. strangulata]